MDPQQTTRDDVLAAMNRFDLEQRDGFEWNDQFLYEVIHDSLSYPLKPVRALATGEAISDFRGDDRLRAWYADRGFEVRARQDAVSIQIGFETVLRDYRDARRTQLFSGSAPVAQALEQLRKQLASSVPVMSRPHLKVVASCGKGNWAHVPWISLLDTRITTSTTAGVYPVYLFNAEMRGVYATLNQGTTEKTRELGKRRANQYFEGVAERTRNFAPPHLADRFALDANISLESGTPLGAAYEPSTIVHRYYEAGRVPASEDILDDLERLLSLYDAYYEHRETIEQPESPTPTIPIADASTRDPSLRDLANELLVPYGWLQDVVALWRRKRHIVFYGPPGTGKTYIARAIAAHLAADEGHSRIVQFHPSYSYEDFVQGFRPSVSGQGFQLRNGPLLDLAGRATKSGQDACLFIDEINRGNVAKVFGELYFLLEYRGEEIQLQYADEPFSLPENLFLVGTMNTADRSIALLDAALRRRFHFFPMFPDRAPIQGILRRWLERHRPEMAHVADIVDWANAKMDDVNLLLGPSYFMQPDLNESWFELTWQHSVLPYLEEQFLDDPERLDEFELGLLREELEHGEDKRIGVVS